MDLTHKCNVKPEEKILRSLRRIKACKAALHDRKLQKVNKNRYRYAKLHRELMRRTERKGKSDGMD
jgi:hypothetical protein